MSLSPLSMRCPLHAIAVAVATTLTLSSCGGGGGGASAPSVATATPPRPVQQSDLTIAQTLYSGAPRTPAGFHEDAAPSGHEHVSTVHLKNTDIDATLTAPFPQHELCTNDWNEALSWSETNAQDAPQYANLVETSDATRYFEFGRVREGNPQFYVRERVFKCTYVNRTTADLRSPQGSAGQLNERPLTANELRTLTEYLWQFTSYNNFGHAVLKSSGATTSSALTHTLVIANLIRAGISSDCDRIDVIAWRHSADLVSGELELDIEVLLSFGAREVSSVAQLCSG